MKTEAWITFITAWAAAFFVAVAPLELTWTYYDEPMPQDGLAFEIWMSNSPGGPFKPFVTTNQPPVAFMPKWTQKFFIMRATQNGQTSGWNTVTH